MELECVISSKCNRLKLISFNYNTGKAPFRITVTQFGHSVSPSIFYPLTDGLTPN